MVLALCVLWEFHLDRELRPLCREGFTFLYVFVLLQCQSPKESMFTAGQYETTWNEFAALSLITLLPLASEKYWIIMVWIVGEE